MTENELLASVIVQNLKQLHDDFRSDLTLMEGRLTERIDKVNAVVTVNTGRISELENASSYRKGAIWAISAIVSVTLTAAGLMFRYLGR